MKKVTMSDIAEELGLSTVSVSKALSGKEGVSDAIREQIKVKAFEMGYKYNSGSKLRGEQGCNIGVLVSETFISDNTYYTMLYQKLVKCFARHEAFCILEIVTRADEKKLKNPAMIENKKVDGVIIMGKMSREYTSMLADIGVPFVFMDSYDEGFMTDSVVSDGVYGTYMLTMYLIKKGHRDIRFVGDVYATNSIMDRYLGFTKALIESKYREWPKPIPDRSEEGLLVDIKLPDPLPDAFVCNCDEAGFMLVTQLKEKGYSVPEDCSVVVFDDFIYAKLSSPALTAFAVDVDMMCDAAANSMIRKLDDSDYKTGIRIVGGELVERDSVRDRRK